MDAKILTENGWKATASKFKIKDNGLQKALAAYEKLDDAAHDDCLKGIAAVSQLAGALRKSKEVAANPATAKYLADLCSAAEAEKSDVTKAKAAAVKAAASAKQADAEAKAQSKSDDKQDSGDYSAILTAALQKLRGTKGATCEFVVCDANPVGLMVARKITAQHKAQLTELTGSKRFLPVGTCTFQDGKFCFTMDQQVAGLARKLQDSIKNFTGKKLPIVAGAELADDKDAPAAAAAETAPQPIAPPKLGKPELAKAPGVWHSTRDILDKNITALKKAVLATCADESPDLIKQIDRNLRKLDGIMDELDTELADSLAKASVAKNDAAKKAELKNSKRILADYIKYVKTEPLIAHVDDNPFGVQTNLKKVLIGSLTHMAQSIG